MRERVYRLLERHLWPREQTDLYFLLGLLNGLMGVTANRLGYPDAAVELTRAGWVYADAIDHKPLLMALRKWQTTVAYERGRFHEARDLAASGLERVSTGSYAATLHFRYAMACAQLGDMQAARQAVESAMEAHARDYSDDLTEIGGEFVISRAYHHCYAGTALALIDGAGDEAAGRTEEAIRLYDEGPAEGEQHWFADRPLAGTEGRRRPTC